MLYGRPGQVDFPAGQVHVALLANLPNGQGPRQVVYQQNKRIRLRLAQEEQNLRAVCPKGKV